ncbi:MAG TPA: fatty acid desaturase [Kofleriaceae bacterium]
MIRLAVLHHLVRIVASFAAMIAFPALAPVAAVAAYLAVFTLTHELAHGALGLSRRRGELALALAGLGIATSGHALRLMHLRHHADPLGAHDLEGVAATLPLHRVLASAPRLVVALVRSAWRTATARDRAWQRAEHMAVAAAAAATLAFGPAAARTYLATAVAMQLLAPLWASHLTHRPPAWLLALARPLAQLGSITLRTLLAHEEHHRHPKLPTYALGGHHPWCVARCAAGARLGTRPATTPP